MMKSKREKALELLLDWAIECDFGYDNIPDEYEQYKDEVADIIKDVMKVYDELHPAERKGEAE